MYKSFSMELAGRTLTVDVKQSGKAGKRRSIHALWRHHCIIYRYRI